MAKKTPKDSSAALAADEGTPIPRVSLGEVGFNTLKHSNGIILEECNAAFRPPKFFRTIDEMRKTAIIASALNAYKMLLSRVKWTVEPPIGASEQEKQRAKTVDSMSHDMEISWEEFIADVIEYIPYGHSVQEKVFRRRLKKNGSRYNDGLVGLRKISPRPQESIARWEFSDDGRDLLAVHQSLASLEKSYLFLDKAGTDGYIRIPREKFMLFTADSTRGNPLGHSILKGVFLAWKQMCMLQEREMLAISKEANGLPLIRIPAKFMADDASDADKAVYATCKAILADLANGTSQGIVFPTFIDPDSKIDMFDVSLLEGKSANGANIDLVIKRYQDEILSTLAVDILKSGNNDGSFSLADSTTNVLALAMSHRLNEIATVLNHDLIPTIYSMNGWSDEVLPKFVPGDITSMSADELGKLIQRTASVGIVVKDVPTVNRVREAMGVDVLPDETKIDDLEFTMESSNSGEGMSTPFDGTAKKPNGKDNSAGNNENAA